MKRILIPIWSSLFLASVALGAEASASKEWKDAQSYFQTGQYFRAARFAFAASQKDSKYNADADALITVSLVRAGLPNAASYFFIRTLQSGNRSAIRRALTQTQELLSSVGVDVLRSFMIKHTSLDDYDAYNRSAFSYALGKATLLEGKEQQALNHLSAVSSNSPVYAYTLQLRGAAHAILGRNEDAIREYRTCADKASNIVTAPSGTARYRVQQNEAEDLESRCHAGESRVLYQADRFEEADRAFDQIPKNSFVWPDILFEQAWNSFARREYNRSLGKLVSYKSPALAFVFNSEVDVLRAQSFLALCLYSDANEVINEFNGKYSRVGEEVKRYVETHANNLNDFYDIGKEALKAPLHTKNQFYRIMNRFIRGPYFPKLVMAERALFTELQSIRNLAGGGADARRGLPAFLDQVLGWRNKSLKSLGGAFVKNSLIDYHSILISDFEKMAFIKLEMLSRAKDKLISQGRNKSEDRTRGNVEPSRRDDQYYWSFNGEFWNDELGDYVFGLESQCSS